MYRTQTECKYSKFKQLQIVKLSGRFARMYIRDKGFRIAIFMDEMSSTVSLSFMFV